MIPTIKVYQLYHWVERCINSCETEPQILTCNRLIEMFDNKCQPVIKFEELDVRLKRSALVQGLVDNLKVRQKDIAYNIKSGGIC